MSTREDRVPLSMISRVARSPSRPPLPLRFTSEDFWSPGSRLHALAAFPYSSRELAMSEGFIFHSLGMVNSECFMGFCVFTSIFKVSVLGFPWGVSLQSPGEKIPF